MLLRPLLFLPTLLPRPLELTVSPHLLELTFPLPLTPLPRLRELAPPSTAQDLTAQAQALTPHLLLDHPPPARLPRPLLSPLPHLPVTTSPMLLKLLPSQLTPHSPRDLTLHRLPTLPLLPAFPAMAQTLATHLLPTPLPRPAPVTRSPTLLPVLPPTLLCPQAQLALPELAVQQELEARPDLEAQLA